MRQVVSSMNEERFVNDDQFYNEWFENQLKKEMKTMISDSSEIYSDQSESNFVVLLLKRMLISEWEIVDEKSVVELVRQLDENEKNVSEKVNHLEELLRKSGQLNSCRCVRLIDQQIENISTNKNQSIDKLILSCNKLGKRDPVHWSRLPNDLQVFSIDISIKNLLFFIVFRIKCQFRFISRWIC